MINPLKSLKSILKKRNHNIYFDDIGTAPNPGSDKKKSKSKNVNISDKNNVNIFEFDWDDVHEPKENIPPTYQYSSDTTKDSHKENTLDENNKKDQLKIDKKVQSQAPSNMPKAEFFSKIRHNHIEVVKSEIANGFRLTSIDEKGNTALHICCQNNHKKMAAILIENGIDVNAVNFNGMTALDFCDYFKFKDLAYYLVLQGAENSDIDKMQTYPNVDKDQFLSTMDIKSFR